MTAKERDERYDTPADVILALKPWLEHSPKLMAGVSGTQAAHDRLSREAMRPDAREPDELEPKKGVPVWVWAVLVAVVMALLAGGVAVAVAMMAKPAAPTTKPAPPTEPTPTTQTAPTTKPTTPATTPTPPTGKPIYTADLTGLPPFEVTLSNDAKQEDGMPPGWSAVSWKAGNKVRVFATAEGLGTQVEKGSVILFAPVQKLDQKAVTVSVEYRSTVADKKLDLRVREVGVQENIVRYLPPTGGEWKTVDVEYDTSKIKSARFEFHNQDTAKDATFEVRKFTVRGGQ